MSVKKLKLKINSEALAKQHGLSAGDTIMVDALNGVPTNREWRNRLKDSKLDECVTIVTATKTSKKREDK